MEINLSDVMGNVLSEEKDLSTGATGEVEVIEQKEVEVEEITNAIEEEKAKDKKEKKEKITEYIYGIPVIYGKINQTTIWKILKEIYNKKDEEGIQIALMLKEKHPVEFAGAKKCLVTKKRIAYIDSITEAKEK